MVSKPIHFNYQEHFLRDPKISGGMLIIRGTRVPVRTILSDPGTYLYLDELRPGPECRPLADDGPAPAACSVWTVPPDAAACLVRCPAPSTPPPPKELVLTLMGIHPQCAPLGHLRPI